MSQRVFRIPAGLPFADELARGLLARAQDNPLALADMLVLLPTRRACRTLRQAFLRQSAGKPLLLPRLMPLGDLDADELMLTAGVALPPAISSRRRQLLLARLIARLQPDLPVTQLLTLARALGRLLDDFTLEAIDTTQLDTLVPDDLSEHWQTTLGFLKPVVQGWPHILAAEQALDPAERRGRLLMAQAQAWQDNPPAFPVIAAGSTGSIPATAALLRVIAGLPQGEIVLPGLPPASESAAFWDALDLTHPLYELKQLLHTLSIKPTQVQDWPGLRDAQAPKRALLHHALLPASLTDAWAAPPSADNPSWQPHGLARLDCANEQEEAGVIALAMRHALIVPGQTAMLVTPDRNLGRRVASTLQRWGIGIDDSAGTPLHKTESATFLRALLTFTRTPSLVHLLALMKHPMAAHGVSMSECRQRLRAIELELLRSRSSKLKRPVHNLAALRDQSHDHLPWLLSALDLLEPLTSLRRLKHLNLIDALTAHLKVAEQLATTDTMAGDQRFWRAESGQALSDWVAELMQAGSDFIPVAADDFDETVLSLMSDVVVRPRYGEHPRLFILGPLEARLQQADLLILGGLNEGSWPAPPEPDPWLSRPMRQKLGLKTPEERLGQEAHDFYTLASAPRVLMTRAIRQENTPTVPARWLSRLDAVLGGRYAAPEQDWLALVRQMDQPTTITPASAPAPRPPVSARPQSLSVTQIEDWISDPYAIYAKKILNLYKLEELEPAPGAAERGSFFHAVLHQFLREHMDQLPPRDAALAQLRQLGEDELKAQNLTAQRSLWWPRFERMIGWFFDSEQQRRHWARPLGLEVEGSWRMDNGFTVKARADRIDKLSDGQLAILDYKTGTLPSAARRDRGFSVQLPLEGAIAQYGNFKDVTRTPVNELTFWRLTGGSPAGESEAFREKVPVQDLIDHAVERLEEMVAQFNNEDTPYLSEPHGDMPVRFSDYRHLARVKEWASNTEDDE